MWRGIEGISIMSSKTNIQKRWVISLPAHPQDLCPLVFFPRGNVKIVAQFSQPRSLD